MPPTLKLKLAKIDSKRNLESIISTRGGSRTAATSKMERFVIIVNGFQPLTIITKRSILNVAAVLDPPLSTFQNYEIVQRIGVANFHSKSSLKLNSGNEIDVKKEIINLPSKKDTRKGNIPAKILNTYLSELTLLIKNFLKNFP